MKTIIKHSLSLVIVLLSITGISAQELSFGAKIGANFSVQSEVGDLYSNDDIKTGIHAGIFAKLPLNEQFSLKLETNYDHKGSAADNVTNNYDYLTVPVLAQLSLGKSLKTPLKFNLYAGP